MTKFTIMSFACFIQAAKCVVADLFITVCLWALAEGGQFCTNEGVLVRWPSRIMADVLKRSPLHLIRVCTVDPVSAMLVFARAGMLDRAAHDCAEWFLYDSKSAAIISVPECGRKV